MADTSHSDLTPDQRYQQLAAILARGVRRYCKRLRRSEVRPDDESSEIVRSCLEVPVRTGLSGPLVKS